MKDISVGIVGCGTAVGHHIAALKSVPGIRSVWFCDSQPEAARRAMQLWGRGGFAGDDFEGFMGPSKPEVLHICTPPASHAGLAVRALEAGCHVLLEKPMATSSEETRRIIEARDISGRKLCMMHNHIFDPPILAARRDVGKGMLGELIYGEGRYFLDTGKMRHENLDRPDHWAYSLKSGIAGEYLPHTVYLLQSFFGSTRELQLMQGAGPMREGGRPRNSYAAQLRFDHAVGRILMIDRMPYGHFSIDLYGTQAAIHVNMMDLTLSTERIRHGIPLTAARMESTVEQSLQKLWQVFSNSVGILTGRLKRRPGHRALVKAFYESIRSGNDVPVPAEDGAAVVRTMEMIDKSVADSAGQPGDR